MKTTRRILSMLLCLALVLGFVPALTMPAQAAEETVTWDASVLGSSTITFNTATVGDNLITLTANKNGGSNAPAYNKDGTLRIYNKNQLVITPSNGITLTKVEFVTTGSSYDMDTTNFSVSAGTLTTGTKTASITNINGAASITLTSSKSSQIRISDIIFTYTTSGSEGGETPACDHAEGKMTWNNDETQHWKECECGNYSTTPADHDFTNSDTCVCGFDKPAVSDEKIYAKYTDSTLVTGEYILLTAKGYAPGVVDGTWISAVQPKKSGENYTDANGGVWTVTVINGDMVELKDANGVVVGPKSKGIETGAGKKWKVIYDSTADTYSFTSEDGQNYLASNHSQSYKFRAYAGKSSDNGYSQVFTLYKLVEATSETPAVPAFDSAAPVLKNDLAMNFYVPKAMFENTGYTNPYAVFNFDGNDYTVSTYTEATVNEVAMLVFTFKNIAPHKADTTITYTLKSTYNGEEVSSESGTYSVLTYCQNKLAAQDSSASLKTLVSDLLNYCAAVQTSLGKTPLDTSAIEGFAPTTAEVTLTSCKAVTKNNIENPVAAWDTATLILKDKVIVRFYFAAESIDGLSVKIAGAKDASITEIKQEGDLYYVDFTGLLATDMREQITATVYSGDTAVSETVTYSIESYAASYQNVAANGMGALVKAMMKYGDSAAKYQ